MVSRFWWTLPGPGGYAQRAAEDLRDGTSVVLRLPAHGPDGVDEVIRSLHDRDWRMLNAEPARDTPVADLLLRRFDPHIPPETALNTRSVVASERLRGHCMMLEMEAGDEAWPHWCDFLVNYAEMARGLAAYERTVFCIILRGTEPVRLPPDSVALTTHRWYGVVSDLDMALFVANRLRGSPEPALPVRTRAAVIARLALWDPSVVDVLADAPLAELFQPRQLLGALAEERQWDSGAIEEPNGWECGIRDRLDGREHVHSAALAAAGDREEIETRVWSGQVGVLFPALELQRRALIQRFGHKLNVPHSTPYRRVITDRRDLELGHILYQLRSDGVSPPRSVMGAIQSLVDMRNALSHFDVVGADLVENPEVRGLTEM